jgi:hypothetical protein
MDREIIMQKLKDLAVLTKPSSDRPEKYYDRVLDKIGAKKCQVIIEPNEIVRINDRYYLSECLYHLISDAIDEAETDRKEHGIFSFLKRLF